MVNHLDRNPVSSKELMGTVPFYLKTTYYFPYFF